MRLSPSLSNVRFKIDLLLDHDVSSLDPVAFKILLMLLRSSASDRVWTYTAPGDGGLRYEDDMLARMAGTSRTIWRKHKEAVLAFFTVADGKIYPKGDWIDLKQGDERPAIPAQVRSEVMQRDKFTCIYCGSTNGPFDVDHIVPFSQGGANVAENLICACWPCNRSKGARTPAQWAGEDA